MMDDRMNNWYTYKNGNATVKINKLNGTRIIETEDDEFNFAFPTNIDVDINHRCSNGCKFCYLNCTPDGKTADLMGQKWVDSLHPYTELAMNLQLPMPEDFIPFLEKLRNKNIFANITVHQDDFIILHKRGILKNMVASGYVHGIGVSVQDPSDELVEALTKYKNLVVHLINGVFDAETYNKLKGHNLKILILGYKFKARGIRYEVENMDLLNKNKSWLYYNLESIMNSDDFALISFDCLGVEQLEPERFISEEIFNALYQGEDGTQTFAINAVDGTFSKSSTEVAAFPIMDTVEEMFAVVKTL